ncbi:PIGW [Lepeophtheirus salmonis]|uniref:Phosphatidylinositol-glycan biosynthesis class W protein n=1 Tax=Lepeophtheirus salmonis TaxID=72036 RepID=A0A7R8H7X2_LEPSM|nr:PIGW [Lepeophtheirus salmonis]CAF2928707.1 PIGW [Lepeophtheirus salmonis]
MDEHYKVLHERFVGNNKGSKDPWEIFGLSLILPASYLLSQLLAPFLSRSSFLLETSLFTLPILLSLTCCSEKSLWILFALLGISFCIFYYVYRKSYFAKSWNSFTSNSTSSKTKVTAMGSWIWVWGHSFLQNGLLSYEARHVFNSKSKSFRIINSLQNSSCLLVLGITRVISVKLLNYQEHVTEYGVHWNFFFTLAFVKILSTLEGIMSLLGYVAIYLGGVYWGVQIQGSIAEDSSIKSCIKLFKSLSFWSIVMWCSLMYSQDLFLLPSRRMANWSYFNWMLAFNLSQCAFFYFLKLLAYGIGSCFFVYLENSKSGRNGKSNKGGKVSSKRKSSFINPIKPKSNENPAIQLPNPASYLLDAVCYNGLPYFLFSNIFTGIVNFFVQTIYATNCYAILILFGYSSILKLLSF